MSSPLTSNIPSLIGNSLAMKRLRLIIERIAPTDINIMLVGESGVGKDLVARMIHAGSNKQNGPYVAVNCAAIPAELLESQLFGHRKGSFTGAIDNHAGFFEQADGGTLFLDEITEASAQLQVKLLRALETGSIQRIGDNNRREVNVRVLSATNRNISAAIADNKLRQDIYYRLAHFELEILPLRNRAEDIIDIAEHVLQELNQRYGSDTAKTFTKAAHQYLKNRQWLGNVRELKHALKTAYIMAPDRGIEAEHFPAEIFHQSANIVKQSCGIDRRYSIGTSLASLEKDMILSTLGYCEDNKQKAADTLGISLKTLYNKLNHYETETSVAL